MDRSGPRWELYTIQIFGVAMIFVGAAIVEMLDENAAEAINRANYLSDRVEDLGSNIDSLERDFKYVTTLFSISVALREIIEGIMATGLQVNRGELLGRMLDVLVADKSTLFDMDSDRFSFGVYLYEPTTQRLDCISCRRPTRAEEDAPHRSWEPGEGHVGLAFQIKREVIAADTSDPLTQALFDAPEAKRQPTDRDRYRSIASIPIRLAANELVGVLVATSDVPGRFYMPSQDSDTARDPVDPLRVLAGSGSI